MQQSPTVGTLSFLWSRLSTLVNSLYPLYPTSAHTLLEIGTTSATVK